MADKELKSLQVPFNLPDNEQCFFIANNASIHKGKQQNYEIIPSEQVEVSGKFYITNRRIIISAFGNLDFVRNLSAIDTISNWNDYLIKLSFRGRDKPLFLEVSKPYLTRVLISNYLNKVRS